VRDAITPLSERRGDWLFVVGFGAFACTSILFDIQTALDVDLTEPANPLVAAYASFAELADPMLFAPPLWFRIFCAMSAFVYGPFYVVLAVAFVRGWNAIRLPALLYCGAVELSMVVCFGVALFGEPHPSSWPIFIAAYAPYALLPAALTHRLRGDAPFSRAAPAPSVASER
jgi:hypothetical protein